MIYIIMCTYNGEKYISEQLESIKENTMKDWELYIIDDQSTDNTLQIVKTFKNRYSNKVHIEINEERRGSVQNFLKAIWKVGRQMTDNDFLMLCDQDDVWNTDKIRKTLDGMYELIYNYGNSIPLLVCTDVTVVDAKMNIINESFRKMNHYGIKKLDFSHLMMENKVQGCTTMMNKCMALMVHRLPTKATMHDGWLALIAAGFGRIKYIDRPTMRYRQHDNNVQGSIEFKEDVKKKFFNLGRQRQIVMDTTSQIKEFLEIYEDEISDSIKEMAKAFATLPQQNFIQKRYNIIKYHMWKSGILRNIGLIVLI